MALADLQIGLAELKDEQRADRPRHEGNTLLVEFPELVQPADRVESFGFAVSDVNDRLVSIPRIAFEPC